MITSESEETPEKKARLDIVEPCTSIPLTEENVARLEGKMSRRKKSVESFDTASSKDPIYVREYLKLNGIQLDNEEGLATAKGGNIVKHAKNLISGERLSPRNKKMLNDFASKLKKHETKNETTFIHMMWWILVDKQRSVKADGYDPAAGDHYVLRREWENDHLGYCLDQEFTRGYLPELDTKGELGLEKLLENQTGMSNPKPDIAYGLDATAFVDVGLIANTLHRDLAQISRGILYPFFLIEFKSYQGLLAEAVNQAQRGGAVLTNTMNLLKERAGISEHGEEFDLGSFAFSLAMNPYNATMYVHWRELRYEGDKTKIIHHTHSLEGYALNNSDSVDKLRIAVNNILDWGVGERKTWLLGMLAQLEVKYQENASARSSEGSKKGKERAVKRLHLPGSPELEILMAALRSCIWSLDTGFLFLKHSNMETTT